MDEMNIDGGEGRQKELSHLFEHIFNLVLLLKSQSQALIELLVRKFVSVSLA